MLKRLVAAVFMLVGVVSQHCHAQTWPDRPIRVIVPFAAGGVPDVLARIISENLRGSVGQPIVVENRAGAGGNVGTEAAARAPADGYTFVLSAAGPLAINPSLYKSLPFDPTSDFEPISLLAMVPNVLVVTDSFPAHSLAQFIAYAKSNPGRINYGSIGNGSSQHLAATQFEAATGTRMVHVPYRSVPQAVTDLISGQIECMFQLVPNIAEQIKAGQVRALGVTTANRSAALPDVPTMKELGVKDYDTAGWFGLLAPRGTPPEVTERFGNEVRALFRQADVQQQIRRYGAEPTTTTPEEFRDFIKSEIDRWREIVRMSGAQVE